MRSLISISAGKSLILNGVQAPKLPVYIDSETGTPHRAFNAYLRYRRVTQKRSMDTVVDKDALHVSSFLNHLYQQVEPNNPGWFDAWRLPTHHKMLNFQNSLFDKVPAVRNQYVSSVYKFYWFCEKYGYLSGVIGITDISQSEHEYPLYVLPPPKGDSADYKIPLLERVPKRPKKTKGSPLDWDNALELAINDDTALGERDELMIRIVRECNPRRMEFSHLKVEQFTDKLTEKNAYITIENTKKGGSRTLEINAELYRDIQDFIEYTRAELLTGKKDFGYVFTGEGKDGHHLSGNYISNYFMDKYGIRPHDGRSVALTEGFMELIEAGLPKQDALMIMSQKAGHSLSSRGSTLEQHYLQAEVLIKDIGYEPVGLLKTKLIKKDHELSKMREKISDQNEQIESLKLTIKELKAYGHE